ncbi:PdxA family dehydrogenase [Anianabacter salinae]|uniref:PdxA family dehydrogenase n=1 Tax=Anianabacter salinae TaxID=2851023 RepID=UPI00225E168E|nr:4-hydroxythreonine-4-phosphate dehydrogenase PdxA [Anianabacter salinae]MBV0913826.1 4-hydroxythreonine-4-phosphate dehydrogenase PdxA [Anianabacter salinae]
MPLPEILVTMGDPNGIGPEIALKAAVAFAVEGALRPVVVGDWHVARSTADLCGLELGAIEIADVAALPEAEFQPGQPTAASGKATVRYLVAALDLLDRGNVRGIVGCPHSETAINASGRPFSGYPNLLAELRGQDPDSVILMLVGGGLRVAHVTLHEPILTALNRITPELVSGTIRTVHQGLRRLGIDRPRIGVMGFNPHAGEGGLFGDQDERIVKPAVEALQAEGLDVTGPEGADLLLGQDGFDAFVAMYHDQGHIPVKLLAGRNISALSLGADVLFSSVGHGAAFDIAGKNAASPEAVLRAARIVGGLDGV